MRLAFSTCQAKISFSRGQIFATWHSISASRKFPAIRYLCFIALLLLAATAEAIMTAKLLKSMLGDCTVFYVLYAHGQATSVLAGKRGGRIIRIFGKRDVVSAHPGGSATILCDYVLSILLTVNKLLKNQAECKDTVEIGKISLLKYRLFRG